MFPDDGEFFGGQRTRFRIGQRVEIPAKEFNRSAVIQGTGNDVSAQDTVPRVSGPMARGFYGVVRNQVSRPYSLRAVCLFPLNFRSTEFCYAQEKGRIFIGYLDQASVQSIRIGDPKGDGNIIGPPPEKKKYYFKLGYWMI